MSRRRCLLVLDDYGLRRYDTMAGVQGAGGVWMLFFAGNNTTCGNYGSACYGTVSLHEIQGIIEYPFHYFSPSPLLYTGTISQAPCPALPSVPSMLHHPGLHQLSQH